MTVPRELRAKFDRLVQRKLRTRAFPPGHVDAARQYDDLYRRCEQHKARKAIEDVLHPYGQACQFAYILEFQALNLRG